MRAVRVAFDFGEGVVLAMHGDPLSRAQAGRNPDAEPEDERNGWMEIEGLMGCAAVEKNRRGEDRDLRDDCRCEQAPEELPEHATAYHISAVTPFELLHEIGERFDSRLGKGVVDRRADAADRSVTLQAVEA